MHLKYSAVARELWWRIAAHANRFGERNVKKLQHTVGRRLRPDNEHGPRDPLNDGTRFVGGEMSQDCPHVFRYGRQRVDHRRIYLERLCCGGACNSSSDVDAVSADAERWTVHDSSTRTRINVAESGLRQNRRVDWKRRHVSIVINDSW